MWKNFEKSEIIEFYNKPFNVKGCMQIFKIKLNFNYFCVKPGQIKIVYFMSDQK